MATPGRKFVPMYLEFDPGQRCTKLPRGWKCCRDKGHHGACAGFVENSQDLPGLVTKDEFMEAASRALDSAFPKDKGMGRGNAIGLVSELLIFLISHKVIRMGKDED